MIDLLTRIEAALRRSEVAADRLAQRHRTLRAAANDTLADLEKLIESEAPGSARDSTKTAETRRANG